VSTNLGLEATSCCRDWARPRAGVTVLIVLACVLAGSWMACAPRAKAQTRGQRGSQLASQSTADIAQSGSYYALVIGINQYRPPLPSLETAVNDAQAIARVLSESYGFQVKMLLNGDASRANILNTMSQYRRSLRGDDNLLIYYAGHGFLDREADKAYWLPADADGQATSNWIIADELTTDIRVQPARHVLIVSDSCYSGGLARDANIQLRPDDQQIFLAKMLSHKSRDLMASGGIEPVSDSGADGHSVFANAFLAALSGITANTFAAEDLFYGFVKPRVAGKSNQLPQYDLIRNSDDENGDFVFIRTRGAKAGRIEAGGTLLPTSRPEFPAGEAGAVKILSPPAVPAGRTESSPSEANSELSGTWLGNSARSLIDGEDRTRFMANLSFKGHDFMGPSREIKVGVLAAEIRGSLNGDTVRFTKTFVTGIEAAPHTVKYTGTLNRAKQTMEGTWAGEGDEKGTFALRLSAPKGRPE
jgi:hypothetical protein